MSPKKILSFFDKEGVSVTIEQIPAKKGSLQVILTNNDYTKDSILICMIHGAPGSGMDFKRYMADKLLLENARLMVIDRPGYGNSSQYFESISEQAKDLLNIIKQKKPFKHLILIGHSYGCAIAAEMAIQNPNLIDKVVFLAGVIDPFNEKVFWYAKLFNIPILNDLLPKDFQTAVYEKINHKQHLLQLHQHWDKLKTPIKMIHGEKDTYLAPYNNVKYARANIPTQFLNLQLEKDKGHLIPFVNRAFTSQIILESIKSLQFSK